MATKNKAASQLHLHESVVLDLARAADETAVVDQWGLTIEEIEEELTPEQLTQSQQWLDSLVAGARLKFTEDDVIYYYSNGKYYSVYGDDAAYDGSNSEGAEELSPEAMAVVLLGIHLDAGTLHVVGESSSGAMLPDGTTVTIKRGNVHQGMTGKIQGEDESDPEAGTEWARYNIVFPDGGRVYKKKHQFDVISESAPSLRFKPDQYNEVPVGAIVTAPEKPGFELQAELQPDLDSDDPENYFTIDIYRLNKKTKSRQSLNSLGGIDGRDADYINQELQAMLQGLNEAVNEGNPGRVVGEYEYRNRKAVVRRNAEWGEFVVQFFSNGEHMAQADYHTDDKTDATGTAKAWIAGGTNPTEAAGDDNVTNRVLNHLKSNKHYSLKLADIANALGMSDTNAVANVLKALAKTGQVSKFRGGYQYNWDEQPVHQPRTESSNMTEREMLDALSKYVKQTLKLSVMDPDYTKNTMFSAQWKVVGNTYYYQLPGRNGKIVAVMNKAKGEYKFDPDGLPKPSFESSHLLGEAKDGEEIAQRNKDRDGQPILTDDGVAIPNSIVFAGGYGGAYRIRSGQVSVYTIDAISGTMTSIEIGNDVLGLLNRLGESKVETQTEGFGTTRNEDPELFDDIYGDVGQDILKHLGVTSAAQTCGIQNDEVDEVSSLDEVPEFVVQRQIDDAESEGMSIGTVWFGTIELNGVKYPCVAEQNASPILFWVARKDADAADLPVAPGWE